MIKLVKEIFRIDREQCPPTKKLKEKEYIIVKIINEMETKKEIRNHK